MHDKISIESKFKPKPFQFFILEITLNTIKNNYFEGFQKIFNMKSRNFPPAAGFHKENLCFPVLFFFSGELRELRELGEIVRSTRVPEGS